MSETVISPMGRRITPGRCLECGERDGWDIDGRGTIFCECQTCPQCGEHDGHAGECECAPDSERTGRGDES